MLDSPLTEIKSDSTPPALTVVAPDTPPGVTDPAPPPDPAPVAPPHARGAGGGATGPVLCGLIQFHIDELRMSGLSDSHIKRSGIRSLLPGAKDKVTGKLEQAEQIREILNWDKPPKPGFKAAMVIPYPDRDRKLNGYARIKFAVPRKGKDGKEVKYESPKGSCLRAYFPPDTITVLADPAVDLLIAEGEKKSLAADQKGFRTIGLAGVDSWSARREKDENGRATGPRQLIPDLAGIPWAGRNAFIVFDSDPKPETNRNVQRAESQLASILTEAGATVKAVRLPPGPPDAEGNPTKCGLDDFFVSGHTADDFRKLLAEAVVPAPPPPTIEERIADLEVLEDAADPHRQARIYLRRPTPTPAYQKPPDVDVADLRLRCWSGEWYKYNEAAYNALAASEVKSGITESVKCDFDVLNLIDQVRFQDREAAGKTEEEEQPPKARQVTTQMVANTLQAVAGATMVPGSKTPPFWFGGDGPFPTDNIIVARNAIIHLPSLVDGKTESEYSCRPTPRFFCLNALDYDFRLDAAVPVRWLGFLAQLWPGDQQAIDFLQTWFGYVLTLDTRQQKMLMIVGPKRSGKGTIARILRAMVGEANVCGPTLSSLAQNFGLWPLIGKQLAIVADARLSGGRSDQDVIVERLLSISGEDSLTIDRKNLQPITMKLSTRFLILSNELPKLGDASGALAGRFLLLHTPVSWYGREDIGLTDRLRAELPGILLWAIEGWRRLREQGKFIQPESGESLLEQIADLGSPVATFVKECCEIGATCAVEKLRLYQAFIAWATSKGVKNPPTESTFGRDLIAACPLVRAARPRRDDGVRTHEYMGIQLAS